MEGKKESLQKAVNQIIADVCEDICNNFCRYRDLEDEETLCDYIREGRKCPLDRLQ